MRAPCVVAALLACVEAQKCGQIAWTSFDYFINCHAVDSTPSTAEIEGYCRAPSVGSPSVTPTPEPTTFPAGHGTRSIGGIEASSKYRFYAACLKGAGNGYYRITTTSDGSTTDSMFSCYVSGTQSRGQNWDLYTPSSAPSTIQITITDLRSAFATNAPALIWHNVVWLEEGIAWCKVA